jgi:CRISPR-associated protein Csm5
MKKYKIKATALSPIHVGSGEMYEPTNYVIDKNYLYYFKEEKFFKELHQKDKNEFLKLVSDFSKESIFKLWSFISKRKEIAKKIASYKVQVSKNLAKEYDEKLGKPTKISHKKSIKEYNQFLIQNSIRTPNSKKLYIPGSSIKGAINTALEEQFNWYQKDVHKELLISDLIPLNGYEIIGYSLNKERFEEDKSGPKAFIETIFSSPTYKSVFEFELTLKKFKDVREIKIQDIITAINNHYSPLFDDMLQDNEIKKFLMSKFKEVHKDLIKNLNKKNQFLLRVGKHSGARAVTIDEKRKILVKIAQIQNKNRNNNDENEIVKKLYKKSYFESDELENLIIDFSKLDEKEKKIMRSFNNFYYQPEKLENLVRKERNLTINTILKEETTTWLFGYQNSLKENYNLPFGWLLCEVMEVIE